MATWEKRVRNFLQELYLLKSTNVEFNKKIAENTVVYLGKNKTKNQLAKGEIA